MKKYNVVDLFCGCGGSAIGIHRHKEFKTLFAVDFWNLACEQYKLNFPSVKVENIDIHNLENEKIKELLNNEEVDVLIGGPPCQGFSMVTRNKFKGNNIEMNNKNHLFLEFLRIANILKPKIIVMENVVGLKSMKDLNGNLILDNIIKTYNDLGYFVKWEIVDIAKLGLPQTRKRMIFIASRNKKIVEEFKYPNENIDIYVSIEEAISNIDNIKKSDGKYYDFEYTKDYNKYTKTLRNDTNIYRDMGCYIGEMRIKRIEQIPKGGDMTKLSNDNPYKTKAKFSSSYKRKLYKDRIGTITNVLKDTSIHPVQNRIYSVREQLRLQNFPDNYKLLEDIKGVNICQMIANAIPPILTEYLFEEVKRVLKEYE